ncbi:MAG TPA: LppX_LprAFG lipoprotein [Acidimicrobiia bacterium]|nr:LppX_LprAFG lipoprotein [Acidimicrobiia bacterium]
MRVRIVPLLIAAALVGGCTGGDETLPDPGELLQRSAAAMASVDTAEFEMTVDGAAITISGLTMRSARGLYVAPDRARAVLTMSLGTITAELGTISIAERTWLTEPLTGRWDELDPGTGFNPAVVFSDEGWEPLLAEDITDATVSSHSRGYQVDGIAPAARIAVVTSGLVTDQDVDITLLIDRDTDRLLEVRFSTTGASGETDWLITLGPYDEPATVEPPA